MVLTDDADWARRARHLSTQAKEDPVEYVHREVGFNYRLTNVLAALGVAQLELLDSYVERKRRIAARYAEAFAEVPGLTLPAEAPGTTSTYWLYTILVDEEKFGMGSRDLLRALDQDRIQARPLWQPLHRSAAHADCDRVGGEIADRLNRDALSLPCSVGLEEADQRRVIERVLSLAR